MRRLLLCATAGIAACSADVVATEPAPATAAQFRTGWDARYGDQQREMWKSLCKTLAWVTPAVARDPSCKPVADRPPAAAYHNEWNVRDWGLALATMYEWTGDVAYLDELGQLDDVLVAGTGGFDAVRGRAYAGWVIDRGCQWGSLDVTGLFGDMLARYARLVSEHAAALDAAHVARATAYADAAARALADTPADEMRGDAGHLLYVTTPYASPACTAQITRPGMPYPYNMDHLMMGAMTDLVVAWANGVGGAATTSFMATAAADLPRLWAQWQGDAVMAVGDDIVLARWPSGSSPTGEALVEDSSHAAVTIELTTRIEREVGPLAAVVPAAAWDTAAALDAGFADTLLDLATSNAGGTWQFPGDMNGAPNETVYARAQESCEGWGLLAPHQARAYARCLDVTFSATGDNVTPANLAALGWMTPAP